VVISMDAAFGHIAKDDVLSAIPIAMTLISQREEVDQRCWWNDAVNRSHLELSSNFAQATGLIISYKYVRTGLSSGARCASVQGIGCRAVADAAAAPPASQALSQRWQLLTCSTSQLHTVRSSRLALT
jgi:hypothetical protein